MNFEGKYHVAFEMTESHKLKRSLFPAPRDTNQRQNTHCHQYKSAYTGYGFFRKIQLLLDRIAVKIYVIQQARNHLLKIIERKYLFFSSDRH